MILKIRNTKTAIVFQILAAFIKNSCNCYFFVLMTHHLRRFWLVVQDFETPMLEMIKDEYNDEILTKTVVVVNRTVFEFDTYILNKYIIYNYLLTRGVLTNVVLLMFSVQWKKMLDRYMFLDLVFVSVLQNSCIEF